MLLEASSRFGGQIETVRHKAAGGMPLDAGAEGFVAASTAVPAVCEALGISEDELVSQYVRESGLWDPLGLEEAAE